MTDALAHTVDADAAVTTSFMFVHRPSLLTTYQSSANLAYHHFNPPSGLRRGRMASHQCQDLQVPPTTSTLFAYLCTLPCSRSFCGGPGYSIKSFWENEEEEDPEEEVHRVQV